MILNNFYFFHRQNIGDGYGWVRTGTDGWTNTLDSIRMGTDGHGGMDKHLGQYTDGYGRERTNGQTPRTVYGWVRMGTDGHGSTPNVSNSS